ncbi:MAG: ABC-2 transporter permease [Candidatus Pelethousia sp.]|nr:ABC-2 transporter permease [Candidatus Pelethousia sp.]
MRGLLKKDIKSLAQQGRVGVLLLVFYGVLFALGGNEMGSGTLMGMLAMLSVLYPITALSYDEKAHWDRYALTMPISRNMLVGAKYLLSLLIALLCALLSLAVGLIFGDSSLGEAFLLSWSMAGVAIFLAAITYPIYFKLGVEKARFVFMAVFLTPTLLLLILNRMNVTLPSGSGAQIERILPLLPLAALALFAASYGLSCRIYAKKEF